MVTETAASSIILANVAMRVSSLELYGVDAAETGSVRVALNAAIKLSDYDLLNCPVGC